MGLGEKMDKFESLLKKFDVKQKVRIGVVCPHDKVSIQAVFNPLVVDYVQPVLIGNSQIITDLLATFDYHAEVVPSESEETSAALAVQLVKEGKLDCLMKGHLATRTFLKAIVNKELGIAEQLLTHVAVNDIPNYHKLLLTTDGGMVLQPTKTEKRTLIAHGVKVMQKLGVKKPKVGLLAAAEIVNPKITSSVEAQELATEFAETADFEIAGPISFDLATNREIAEIKHYENPVAGEADVLVGPDITTMNVLGKSLTGFSKATMAGIVMGAKVPIVMVSRGSNEKEKAYSILVAMYCSKE